MVPRDKFDLESVTRLREASDDEVIGVIPEILPWLADCNWPVFSGICSRLSILGDKLSADLKSVLSGDDTILKCNIVGHLFPLLNDAQLEIYRAELEEICRECKMEDIIEGLVDYAEIQLSRLAKHT